MEQEQNKFTKDGFLHTKKAARIILDKVYASRCTLVKYLQLNDPDKTLCLFDNSASPELKHLLNTTLVACNGETSFMIKDQRKISREKNFSMNDIVDRIISVFCIGKGQNNQHVLSQGYQNNPCGVPQLMSLECLHPNTMVAYITSGVWRELHDRIGSDLMVYLLRNMSVFVKAKSSCYFQVSGQPIHEILPTCKISKALQPGRSVIQQNVSDGVTLSNRNTNIVSGLEVCKQSLENSGSDRITQPASNTHPQNTCSDFAYSGHVVCTSVSGQPLSATDMETGLPSTSKDMNNDVVSLMTDDGNLSPLMFSDNDVDKATPTLFRASDMDISGLETSPILFPDHGDDNDNTDKSTEIIVIDSDESLLDISDPNIAGGTAYRPIIVTDSDESSLEMSVDEPQPTKAVSTLKQDIIQIKREKNVDKVIPDGTDRPVIVTGSDERSLEMSVAEPDILPRSTKAVSTVKQAMIPSTRRKPSIEDIPGQDISVVDCSENPDRAGSSDDLQRLEPPVKKMRVDYGSSSCKLLIQPTSTALPAGSSGKRKLVDLPCSSKKIKVSSGGDVSNLQVTAESTTDLPVSDNVKSLSNEEMKGKAKKIKRRKPRKRKKRNKAQETTRPNPRRLDRNIFYSTRITKKCFHEKHVMETTPVSRRGARTLLNVIFGGIKKRGHTQQSKKPQRLSKRIERCSGVFLQFLKRHKSCSFHYFLNRFCPDEKYLGKSKSAGKRSEKKKSEKVEIFPFQIKHVSNSKVHDFCRSVCERVVPPKLWGSKRNKKTFFANLRRFISLRKLEEFPLQQIMKGIKVNDCEFLKLQEKKTHVPATDFQAREKLLSDFYFWLMNSYLTPLLSRVFSITEASTHRNRIFYFRKSDWRKMAKTAVEHLTKTSFTRISESEAKRLVSSNKSLGYSPLRFVPKPSGTRPLVNMSLKDQDPTKKYSPSINQQIKQAFLVLGYERKTFPKKLGAGDFGLHDILKKLKSFAARHKTLPSRPLYFVSVDVRSCYDSIKHDKLFEVIKDQVFTEDEYMIRRYCTVTERRRNVLWKTYNQFVTRKDNCRTFPEYLADTIKDTNLRNAIVVDQVRYPNVRREDILNTLTKLIAGNIVKFERSFYRQKCGIAQGSLVSPMLCNYYYGHLENHEFPHLLSDPDSVLFRYVDDSLLITSSLDYANQFLSSMLQGFPEYNCSIKEEKTLVNFEAVTVAGEQVRRLSETAKMFPCCGFLINMQTLEIQVDYSRYEGKDAIWDSLTVDLSRHSVASIIGKLKSAVLLKSHQIFLDLCLNTKDTVLINMFQAFLYTAERFRAHCRHLPKGQNVNRHPTFFVKGLEDVVRLYYRHVKRLIGDTISQDQVCGLFMTATLSVLRKKPTRYIKLIKMLLKRKKKFHKVQGKMDEIAAVAHVAEFSKLR